MLTILLLLIAVPLLLIVTLTQAIAALLELLELRVSTVCRGLSAAYKWLWRGATRFGALAHKALRDRDLLHEIDQPWQLVCLTTLLRAFGAACMIASMAAAYRLSSYALSNPSMLVAAGLLVALAMLPLLGRFGCSMLLFDANRFDMREQERQLYQLYRRDPDKAYRLERAHQQLQIARAMAASAEVRAAIRVSYDTSRLRANLADVRMMD